MPVYVNEVPRTCRLGDINQTVKFMQERLNGQTAAGLVLDGNMGSKTSQALLSFQKGKSLVADAICGPKTWAKLLGQSENLTRYMQNDPVWKNVPYTSTNNSTQTIGSSGCGPVCLASALTAFGITVKPPELCGFAVSNGYRTINSGTSWGFFEACARHYGCKVSSVQPANLKIYSDGIVIASMGPDGYTKSGHYICLIDYDPYNGLFYTHDPVSKLRNSCSSDIPANQGKMFWLINAS